MNITLVNGINSDPKWEVHEESLKTLTKELEEAGHKVDYFPIREMNLHYCQGCWDCWTKTPGLCRMKDEGEEYLKSYRNTDLLLYCSPVSAGFITTETKKALDRFIPNALPHITFYEKECHHLERYPERDITLGVVLMDDGNINKKSSDLIFRNFDRIQKNMRSKKAIRFALTTENREELYSEIINN